MDIAEIGRRRLEAGRKALLLDMHVVGVEMDEDVFRADPLDDFGGVAAAIDQMRLVAVAGLDADFRCHSPCLLGGAFEEAAHAVDLLLRRAAPGGLADRAVGDAAERLAADLGAHLEGRRQEIERLVGTLDHIERARQPERADQLDPMLVGEGARALDVDFFGPEQRDLPAGRCRTP